MVRETDCLNPLLEKPCCPGPLEAGGPGCTEASQFGQKGVKVELGGFIGERSRNENAEVSERKRALDLFCGTKSVTRTLEELGFAVTTFDVRPECKADFTVDIRNWKY